MRVLNCNIKGLGLPKKRRILYEFLLTEYIDILCLQETKKKDIYSPQFLKSISKFYDTWNYIPSVGLAGGLLISFSSKLFNSIA
jgi:exonuclease III